MQRALMSISLYGCRAASFKPKTKPAYTYATQWVHLIHGGLLMSNTTYLHSTHTSKFNQRTFWYYDSILIGLPFDLFKVHSFLKVTCQYIPHRECCLGWDHMIFLYFPTILSIRYPLWIHSVGNKHARVLYILGEGVSPSKHTANRLLIQFLISYSYNITKSWIHTKTEN